MTLHLRFLRLHGETLQAFALHQTAVHALGGAEADLARRRIQLIESLEGTALPIRNLPLESRIHEFQDGYYEAIASCHAAGNSNAFIEFMLDMIDLTLDWAIQQTSSSDAYFPSAVQKLLAVMEYDTPYTATQLMTMLELKSRVNFRKNYLDPALKHGLIVMSIPDKPTSRNQTYIRS